MRLNNKVFQNASWIIVCRVAQMVLNLVVGMISARLLGPSNYGLINYACSIIAFVIPIMQLGLSSIMVHELMRDPANEGEILGTAVFMSGISALLCIMAVAGFVMIANVGEKETLLVCIICSISLVFQSMELVVYWFQTKLLSKYTSLMMFFAYVVTAVYKLYLLFTGRSIYWYAMAMSIDHGLVAIGYLYFFKKMGGKGFSVSLSRAKALFAQSRYYIVSALMITLFSQTDRVMIKIMIGDAQTGFYSCAVNCAGMTNFVFAAIVDSMRPIILKNKQKGKEVYEKSLALLYCIIIYLALAQSIGITLLARPVITILYGAAYLPAVSALQIIVWNCTFSYIGAVRDIWILAEKKQKYLWKINLCGAITNVVLNTIWIPIWGINGAALATVLTQIFTNIIVVHLIKPTRYINRIMFLGLNVRKNILEYLK